MTPGTLLQGRFELGETVASGGMGLIYRAHDRLEGVPVAVKVLRGEGPVEIERFERESAVLAQLHHPGIVRHIAHGQSAAGERYLVLEWLEGEDLRRRLARAPLTPAESLTLLHDAASALAVAHASGVVHNDVKPSNLFLVAGSVEQVRVVDFGVAALLHETEPTTAAGMLVGTPGYMAPERARGLPVRGASADVFSLGCVLFECLTGRRAFRGVDIVAILAKVQLQEAPSLRELRPDLPEALALLVGRMMARDPDERLPDASSVVSAIEAIGGFQDAPAPVSERSRDVTLEVAHTAGEIRLGGLGMDEQRVVTVVMASAGGATGFAQREAGERAALDVARHGGHLDVLASGVMLVTLWGEGGVIDRAARACRCGLGLLHHFPDLSVSVVTGRGKVSARVVAGGVINRGALVLHATPPGAVRLDAPTAEMVRDRFVVAPGSEGPSADGSVLLCAERDPQQATHPLLGHATSFVGRSLELSLLEGKLYTCVEARSASAVLVTGETGSGKSRLCRELIDRVRWAGRAPEVITGRADAAGERAPFGIIADALRRASGVHDGESIDVRRRKLEARIGRHLGGTSLSRVVAFLGELSGTPFPDTATPSLRTARTNAHLMGDAIRSAWEDWLAAECAAQPVVLVLEDLHWGDVSTIKLVDATLRNLHDLPLLVLAPARPEIHARFVSLWAGRQVLEIKLRPLPRKASVELVREALGKGATAAVIARVVEHGNGNPLYLEELVRAVAAGRADTFPDSVLGMVEARLDAEGAPAKRVLRAASVFGERFSLRGVEALLRGDTEELRERLARLVARELVVGPTPLAGHADAQYGFCHALVREAAYATLTEDDRALGHRLAGEWLEGSGSVDAVALAEHFVRGGEPGRAVAWWRRSAEQALAADDLTATLELVGRGAACGAAGEDLGALRLIEAEAYLWRGELAEAERRGIEASTLCSPGSGGWFHGLYQGVVAAGKLGHFDRVEASFASAGGTRAAGGAEGARVGYLCACASNLIFGGRYGAADAAFDALALLTAPDALSAALIHQSRSFRASARGDSGACLDGLTAALVAFEHANDRRNATMCRVNLGFTLAQLGELEGAEESLRAALSAAARMGLHDVAALARTNLGYVLGCEGKFDEARTLTLQAIDAHRRQHATRDEGLARTYLAQIELHAGNCVAAEREARAAAEVLQGAPSIRAGALAVGARALLGQQRVSEALATAGAAYAELSSLGSVEEGEALIRLVYAEALAAAGRTVELATVTAEARSRLLTRASQISDLRWRERFLTRVPDNVRTFELAAASLPER